METLRERLADQAHRSWSDWMAYLFGKCRVDEHGYHIIPPGLVERWRRQMATDYADLTELEQRSDLDEANKYLAIILAPCGREIIDAAQQSTASPAGRLRSG